MVYKINYLQWYSMSSMVQDEGFTETRLPTVYIKGKTSNMQHGELDKEG